MTEFSAGLRPKTSTDRHTNFFFSSGAFPDDWTLDANSVVLSALDAHVKEAHWMARQLQVSASYRQPRHTPTRRQVR
ncbi:hypothetical protein BN2476_190025 [Paraburkholderia piptadeniae]|uniref:Uncharacterized protein n=1 Tax=Paraburkholderia piptadeniae TaxID=1701573 RepID=A0A1N7RUL1_9BURK|nr:hypothetical protein BN2476_190025 [Paraburkholderia piptadeniae]